MGVIVDIKDLPKEGLRDATGGDFIKSQPQPQQLSEAGKIGVRALQAPFSLGETAKDVVDWAGQKLLGGVDTSEIKTPWLKKTVEEYAPKDEDFNISEKIGGYFGGEEALKPEGFISSALQKTAGSWPLLFVGPGSIAGKLGADVAGSTAMTAVEKGGFGPWAQLGAGVLGSAGFSKASNLIKGALGKNTSPSKVANLVQDLYKKEQSLGAKIPVKGSKLKRDLLNLRNEVDSKFVGKRFDEAAKSRSIKNIDNAFELLDKPSVSASDLFKVKKGLNEIWMPGKSIEGSLYKRLSSLVRNDLGAIAEKHPEWGNAWKQADELHKVSNWQGGFSGMLKELKGQGSLSKIVTNPIAYGALSLIGGPVGAVTGAVAGLRGAQVGLSEGKRAVDFIKALGKTKDGQKLLWEIAANSAKGATKSFAQNLNKLNKKAALFEKSGSPKGGKILPSGSDLSGYKEVNIYDYLNK